MQMRPNCQPMWLRGRGASSCVQAAHIGHSGAAADVTFGVYGTHVSTGTAKRPEGLGGSTG